jgi:cyclase
MEHLMKIRVWKVLPAVAMFAAGALFLMTGPAGTASAQQKGKGKAAASAEVRSLHVQGNVYMIVGPGGNTTVQIGPSGILVVDTQVEPASDQIIAEIRRISDKPIRYVVNTSFDPDHVGGNARISRAGVPVVGGNLGAVAFENGATIVAHENVLAKMQNAGEGQKVENPDMLPTTTFFEGQKEIFFNEEPVLIMHQAAAHTNGDSVVFFRRSDVIAAGDVFDMTAYPHIDIANGGNIKGVINALNLILDLCIPKHEQEGGTFVIPGHGRLTDEHDVLEYRDMVTIIRDRIQAGMAKGQTLAQIKAAKPTYEYDPRYGSTSGSWTTDMFVEAVYKSLGGK